jgi:uncharacterized membrane protein
MSVRAFRSIFLYSALLFCVIIGAEAAQAQSYNPFNERDDKYRLLGLKRAKEAYEVARSDYDRKKELHDKSLITNEEFERAHSIFSDAEVNYQQSLLAVLFEEQYVSVSSAVKYHSRDGSRKVRLTLVNTSGGTPEFQKLINVDDALFRSLQPDVINNVYISILNDDNAIISQPYEAKIPQLRYGEPVEVEFSLLQDLDAVTVFIVYANGSQRTMKIFLQKDATVDRVEVQSEQFSQEIELGKTASYDLTLELFSGTANTFSLEVVNLPREIGRFFKDPSGRVRLSQVKFNESSRTKDAALEIALPDRTSDAVAMDVPIPFYVLVIPRNKSDELSELTARTWTAKEVEALGVGYVRLELLPRGKGELLVRAPQLYHSISADESAEMYIDLVNEGSHRLDNIEVQVDPPLNWNKVVEPTIVPSLEIGAEARVRLSFQPPPDVAVGKYEVRLRTTGMSNNQPVPAEDKTVTVEIKPGTNILGTALLILFVLALVGGMVVFGIRLSRR